MSTSRKRQWSTVDAVDVRLTFSSRPLLILQISNKSFYMLKKSFTHLQWNMLFLCCRLGRDQMNFCRCRCWRWRCRRRCRRCRYGCRWKFVFFGRAGGGFADLLVPDTRVLPACGLGVVIDEVAARVSFGVFRPEFGCVPIRKMAKIFFLTV